MARRSVTVKRRSGSNRSKPLRLTVKQILAWVDAHRKRTGKWPTLGAGSIIGAPAETWANISMALRKGSRGLRGGTSLADLLERRRGARTGRNIPRLTARLILNWADAHHRRQGKWPNTESATVWDSPSENWRTINGALTTGARGLPGGDTLASFLNRHRGVRAPRYAPALSIAKVLSWADAHHRKTGQWPTRDSGKVLHADAERWSTLNVALQRGQRGLPGGITLPQLLAKHRGVPNRISPSPLTHKRILEWADDHHRRTGRWPTGNPGRVRCTQYEKWNAIAEAMLRGRRGLPARFPLHKLLLERRGARTTVRYLPPLSLDEIIRWVDKHRRRTGAWPTAESGPVPGTRGETWKGITGALQYGSRGLPSGLSIPRLLSASGRVWRRPKNLPRKRLKAFGRKIIGPRLTQKQILQMADRYYKRTRRWPHAVSGAVPGEQGLSWWMIHEALMYGRYGLPGGSSLSKLLHRYGLRNRRWQGPKLTLRQILAWVDAHAERTQCWPARESGRVHGAPREKWHLINAALRHGYRGLKGGSSLAKLLNQYRRIAWWEPRKDYAHQIWSINPPEDGE